MSMRSLSRGFNRLLSQTYLYVSAHVWLRNYIIFWLVFIWDIIHYVFELCWLWKGLADIQKYLKYPIRYLNIVFYFILLNEMICEIYAVNSA